MSKVKRILAVALAMAMVMAMSMASFAAPSGSVTVNLPDGATDATVTYKQIIVEDRTSDLGWKFASAEIERAFVDAYRGDADMTAHDVIAALIETGRLENVANANVSAGTINDSEALARSLAGVENMADEAVEGHAFTPTSIGLYVIRVAKDGYTFIPMSAYVGTDFTGLTVTAKGSKDQITKVVEQNGQTVSQGDVVTYTVTAQYPYYSADATDTKFRIIDTVVNGTVMDTESYPVTVKIGGTQVAAGYTKDISADADGNSVLTVDFAYDAQYAGRQVEISYSVTVGDVSSANPLRNTARSEIETGATQYVVESNPVTFEVTKTDADTGQTLAGAEFTLYVEVAQGTEGAVELRYKGPEDEEEKTVYGKAVTTQATGSDGRTTFDGLDAQKTYYVAETKAPEGYSLNTTVYKLDRDTGSDTANETTLVEGGVKTITTTYHFGNFTDQTVTDTKLSALPSTGGAGIIVFTIIGCVIMIGAAAMFFLSGRKKEE